MNVQWDWLVPLALCWAGLATWVVRLRRRRDNRAARWMCVALAALAASMTLQLEVVYPAVDAVTTPGFTAMASNCLTVLAIAAARCTFLHMELPTAVAAPRVTRWLVLLVAVCAVMVVLFATAPSNYVEFAARVRGTDPVPLVSWSGYAYVAYVAPAATGLGWAAWRYARLADRFTLRLGLQLLAASSLVTAAYAVVRLAGMVAYDAGVQGAARLPVGPLFRLAIVLLLLGLTLPLVSRRLGLDRVVRWVALNRQYRLLFPLWDALRTEFPGISLDPSPRRLPFAAPDAVLYRRMIEIWDGLLLLRPYVDGVVDAAAVHEALRRKRAGALGSGGVAPAGDGVAELTDLARRYRALSC